jgi:hypothetical protein
VNQGEEERKSCHIEDQRDPDCMYIYLNPTFKPNLTFGSCIILCFPSLIYSFTRSDVPARLWLKAPALAWPETALAFEIPRPSRGPKPSQSRGRLWPGDGFSREKKKMVSLPFAYHTTRLVSSRSRPFQYR